MPFRTCTSLSSSENKKRQPHPASKTATRKLVTETIQTLPPQPKSKYLVKKKRKLQPKAKKRTEAKTPFQHISIRQRIHFFSDQSFFTPFSVICHRFSIHLLPFEPTRICDEENHVARCQVKVEQIIFSYFSSRSKIIIKEHQ